MNVCLQWLPPPGELGQASLLYSPVCHPGLKNKIKLVLLNYLLSAKSRWFSLGEKGILRMCDQTLARADNRGVCGRRCTCTTWHSHTNKRNKFKGELENAHAQSKIRHAQEDDCTHAWKHTLWKHTHKRTTRSSISGVSEVCHLLFGRCEGIGQICDLCCDCEACFSLFGEDD